MRNVKRYPQFKDMELVMQGKKAPTWAPVELQLDNNTNFYLPLEHGESYHLTTFA